MCPREAYNLAIKNGPSKELEPFIARDYWCSLDYAKEVLKSRFILGEAAIARHALTSYIYAQDILKGPFPAGECAISNFSDLSLDYARYVLKGPFIIGESKIVLHASVYPEAPLDYQFRFNRSICPVQVLSRFPAYSLSHAIMIGSRFPEGEPAMKKSPRIWKRYQEFINESKRSV